MERPQFCFEFGITTSREFENCQHFVGGFRLPVPMVDRMHVRQNVRARGQPKIDNLFRDSARNLDVRNCAKGDERFLGHSLGRDTRWFAPRWLRPTDPTAANNNVGVVNDRRLAGRNGALRFV